MCASPMLSATGAVPVSPQPPAVDAAEGEGWTVKGLPKARFRVERLTGRGMALGAPEHGSGGNWVLLWGIWYIYLYMYVH